MSKKRRKQIAKKAAEARWKGHKKTKSGTISGARLKRSIDFGRLKNGILIGESSSFGVAKEAESWWGRWFKLVEEEDDAVPRTRMPWRCSAGEIHEVLRGASERDDGQMPPAADKGHSLPLELSDLVKIGSREYVRQVPETQAGRGR